MAAYYSNIIRLARRTSAQESIPASLVAYAFSKRPDQHHESLPEFGPCARHLDRVYGDGGKRPPEGIFSLRPVFLPLPVEAGADRPDKPYIKKMTNQNQIPGTPSMAHRLPFGRMPLKICS